MAGDQAVEFSVAPLAAASLPWSDSLELNLRLESKRFVQNSDPSGGKWQHVSEESVRLQGVNVVTRLDRAQYAYRLSLWPTTNTTEWAVAFPFYLAIPALPPRPDDDTRFDMCPPSIGTFAIARTTDHEIPASKSAAEAAAVLGGTLAAALLLYSLFPYMKLGDRKRRRTRSENHSDTINGEKKQCKIKNKQTIDIPASPTGRNRRTSGQCDYGIEPAGAHRDEIREKRGRTASNNGSELVFASLPDFNDERGWRDFFDSQIYHNEPEQEQGSMETRSKNIQRRHSYNQDKVKMAKLRHAKSTTTEGRGDKYRTIKDRIDRAAMEAAIDDAECFFEFWQT